VNEFSVHERAILLEVVKTSTFPGSMAHDVVALIDKLSPQPALVDPEAD
jgi:hypothetical protein